MGRSNFPAHEKYSLAAGTSLVVQWLRLHAPNAGVRGSIPGQGTGSHMPQLRVCMPQLRSQQAAAKTRCNQINKYFKKRKVFFGKVTGIQIQSCGFGSAAGGTQPSRTLSLYEMGTRILVLLRHCHPPHQPPPPPASLTAGPHPAIASISARYQGPPLPTPHWVCEGGLPSAASLALLPRGW